MSSELTPEQKAELELRASQTPCLLCGESLGPQDILWERRWHHACEKCSLCGHPMPNPSRISQCLNEGIAVSHILCFEKEKVAEIKTKVIPLTRYHVQALNSQILTLRHQESGLPEDIKLLQDLLNDMRDCTANVSYVLTLTKDKIRIADSQDYAEKIKVERKVKADATAVEEEKKARLAAERADPALRDKRKMIEGFMKTFNIDLATATAMVEGQTKSKPV